MAGKAIGSTSETARIKFCSPTIIIKEEVSPIPLAYLDEMSEI